jgi:hypothetical protein
MPTYTKPFRMASLTADLSSAQLLSGTVAALFVSQVAESDLTTLDQLTEASFPGYSRKPLTWGAVGYLIGSRAYAWASSIIWQPSATPTAPVQVFAWGIILPGSGTPPGPDTLMAYGVLPTPLVFTDATSVYTMSIQVGTDMPGVLFADG